MNDCYLAPWPEYRNSIRSLTGVQTSSSICADQWKFRILCEAFINRFSTLISLIRILKIWLEGPIEILRVLLNSAPDLARYKLHCPVTFWVLNTEDDGWSIDTKTTMIITPCVGSATLFIIAFFILICFTCFYKSLYTITLFTHYTYTLLHFLYLHFTYILSINPASVSYVNIKKSSSVKM